jgi:acyl carrier protein
VILDALPRSPNGKVDRRALPVPDAQRPALAETFIGPRTSVEEIVNRIWREVLDLERIGIHENFFELGGHSLLATQVISRVRNIFGVDVPMHRLFQTPTIAELADFVEKMILERLAALSEEEAQCLAATQRGGFPV